MEQLAQLSSLAAVLNQETDSYTKSLTELEKKLNKLNLGVEAWVVLTQFGPEGYPGRDSYKKILLGYAKTDDGWGFAIQDMRVERGLYHDDPECPWQNDYQEGPPKLLLKSSRELRIKAAERLEELLNFLVERANEVLPTLQKAKQVAQSFSGEASEIESGKTGAAPSRSRIVALETGGRVQRLSQ